MSVHAIRREFVRIMAAVRDGSSDSTKRLGGYQYISPYLQAPSLLVRYYYGLLNDLHYVEDLVRGAVIVDAGCGSGSFSLLLSLLGAKKVYAVDYLAECAEMARYVASTAGATNIEVIQSDIGKLELPEMGADGIFSVEAISHYRDYKSFLRVASRSVKPTGFLVVRDGNNGASRKIRERTFRIWRVFEKDPNPASIYGHVKTAGCYRETRKRIISQAFPDLSGDKIDTFSDYTFAYSAEKIREAVGKFCKGDFSLRSDYDPYKCPLDPLTDCHMEQLFDPRELAKEIRNHGFQTRTYSAGPSRPSLRMARYAWEKLSFATIYYPRAFKIVARRMKE